MKNNIIINEANRVLNDEIIGIKSLNKTFNNKFINLVKGIVSTKGRVVVTGIGKSGHIANKISATLASTGTPAISTWAPFFSPDADVNSALILYC